MPNVADASDKKTEKRAILAASLSLALFALFTAAGLWAASTRNFEPRAGAKLVAGACVLAGLAAAALVLRKPSRTTVGGGIVVMAFSLLRAGSPASWTSTSYELFAITALLLIPLVHAVIILPRSAR